jgi:PAS domain S-box-containing protein
MSNFLGHFANYKVKTKLVILNIIFLVSLILLGSVVNLLFKSSQTITILTSEHKQFLEEQGLGLEYFYRYKLSGNKAELNQSVIHLTKANDIASTFGIIDSLLNVMPKNEWLPYMFNIYGEGVSFDKSKIELMGDQIKIFSKINPKMLSEITLVSKDASNYLDNLIQLIGSPVSEANNNQIAEIQSYETEIKNLSGIFTQKLFSLSNYLFNLLFILILILVIILGGIVTFISVRISNSISKPINKLADNFKKIAVGNLTTSVNIDSKNEIGDLSNAFLKIQIGLQEIVSYSKKVAKGDYSTKLEPKSEVDELTVSLNKMADKLAEIKLKTEKENWIQKGVNGLDDEMRGNWTVRDLSKKIISYLSNFLGFEIGAIYVYDEVLEHLELTGSIGLNTTELQQIVQIGEGLIGNAASQDSLQMLNTKNKYHKVFSASGEMIPEKIFLLPVHFNNYIQAVIEIAPINELSENKIEFLNLIKDKISVNLNASVVRYRNLELLEKTLEQSKILREREDDLVKNLAEIKNIQGKLIQEKALLDAMLQTIPDYVYFKDLDSKFLRISDSMVHLFEVNSTEKIIGKSDFDFHTKENANKYFEEEQKIIREKRGFIDDIRQGIDENKDVLWTSVTKLPMFDETGKCIGTFGISKNVTEIKQYEVEINEQYKKLEEKQNELSVLNNELNFQKEELKNINEELKAQEEELRVANEELADQTKILSKSEKSLQVQQEELKVINEELELKSNELEIQKVAITDKNSYLVKAQKELEQKAKELELASQYKSEFLANMSHELRTPLNSLLILSKLLENNKSGNLNDDQVKSAGIIYKSGKDLLELINEILDLSKIEAGKMSFEFSNVLSEDIITEIDHGFKPVAESKGLYLELYPSEQFPKTIYTDKQRLIQIIRNILSNAFKFTVSGGIKIKFGIPKANIKFASPQLNMHNTCYVSVEDTGVGIPKNKFDSIFEAFQQADGSISRKFGGTGLGLSISKELIRVLGGEIQVESKENIGSVFTIFLPLNNNLTETENNTKLESISKNKLATRSNPSVKTDISVEKTISIQQKIPVFIEDDRESKFNGMALLIIHPDKEKAKELLFHCRQKNFNAVVAGNISDSIKLAEKYSPKAIIMAEEINLPAEYEKLKNNIYTSNIPIHHVNRFDDTFFDNLEELKTPSTVDTQVPSNDIQNLIGVEFKQILIVEDDHSTQQALHLMLKNKDLIIHDARTGKQAFEMISAKQFDCVILDLGLPDFSGIELLEKLNAHKIQLPYIIIHTARELTKSEIKKLNQYSESIVIKGIKSDDRLMDELSIFLHHVENKQPKKQLSKSSDFSAKPIFKGKKILLVDDDIRNTFALAQILEEKGVEIFEAENGEVAIETLKNNKDIDLILMDIMMPIMDGYETMKIIRQMPDFQKIPIITLTAKAMKEDYQKAIDSGANDYISKPLDTDKLFELLKIWLFK